MKFGEEFQNYHVLLLNFRRSRVIAFENFNLVKYNSTIVRISIDWLTLTHDMNTPNSQLSLLHEHTYSLTRHSLTRLKLLKQKKWLQNRVKTTCDTKQKTHKQMWTRKAFIYYLRLLSTPTTINPNKRKKNYCNKKGAIKLFSMIIIKTKKN